METPILVDVVAVAAVAVFCFSRQPFFKKSGAHGRKAIVRKNRIQYKEKIIRS